MIMIYGRTWFKRFGKKSPFELENFLIPATIKRSFGLILLRYDFFRVVIQTAAYPQFAHHGWCVFL
jgi:hypothetical protein